MQDITFCLIRQGEGPIEESEEDIFNENYIRRVYHREGTYKVLRKTKRDDGASGTGTYTTSSRIRTIQLKEYNAPKEDIDDFPETEDGHLNEVLKDFDKKHEENLKALKSPNPPTVPSDGYSIVRKDNSDKLKIIDGNGNTVFDDFNLEQLKMAKEQFSATDPLKKDDLKNQNFIKFVLVFLLGLGVGVFGTFMVLKQQHAKEMASVYAKLDAISQQLTQKKSAPRTINEILIEEYNRVAGGPVQ